MKYLPLILLLISLLISPAIGSKLPSDSRQAHQAADGIYELRMRAAYNEWGSNHRKPGESDQQHFSTINAQDQERWNAVRTAFHNLDEAMKRAGY